MKKNEQGSFQRRFVCIVPHMFLYYFENEMADSPRGIIDLELLDNITREHDVLKLSTADEHTWRSVSVPHGPRARAPPPPAMSSPPSNPVHVSHTDRSSSKTQTATRSPSG